MTHQITLRFEDGATQIIDCRAGESVADAALRARISIPLDCRDGVCGTCKATWLPVTISTATTLMKRSRRKKRRRGGC